MRRVRAGEAFAIEGLWMTVGEAAAAALRGQPANAEECGRHLNKALAVIELKAHVARWGREGYPPPSGKI